MNGKVSMPPSIVRVWTKSLFRVRSRFIPFYSLAGRSIGRIAECERSKDLPPGHGSAKSALHFSFPIDPIPYRLHMLVSNEAKMSS